MTEIRLTNTRTRTKEPFAPINPENVRMYVCGPTVYDRAHLGNARPAVVFDVLYRLLRHVYGADHVTYVRNITDVEDKIIDRARANGEAIENLTRRTTDWYHADMDALGVLRPNEEPHATDYVVQMIEMIEALIARGCAYAADGHVLFSVASFPDYGALSGRSVEDMIAGARVEVAPYKRDPMDFVLWKPSADDEPGWESPWGRGRPGWHIECSAMSEALLGASFDIHGGGADLMFPHHENEVAQSCCAHPEGSFARYWLHNEMLLVEGRKMSKSLGNFFTVRDLLEGRTEFGPVTGEEIRLAFLLSHYRAPMDLNATRVETARAVRAEICEALGKRGSAALAARAPGAPIEAVVARLADDLDTPGALAELRGWLGLKRKQMTGEVLDRIVASLELLGLDLRGAASTEDYARLYDAEPAAHADPALAACEARLAELRAAAKQSGDFAEADALKAGLVAAGVEVRILPAGPFLIRQATHDPAAVARLAAAERA
jgi:cysteinyl-tRNA synthetase